jgi:hypothetical protein
MAKSSPKLFCDVCEEEEREDFAVGTYAVTMATNDRFKADLCDDDAAWLRELQSKGRALKRRRTAADMFAASPEDIPRINRGGAPA